MQTAPDPLMTAKAVADLLGMSSNTVLDWWQRGELPGFKLNGRAVRFRRSEILEWLEAQRA